MNWLSLRPKNGFELSEEVSDEELESVACGGTTLDVMESMADSELQAVKESTDAASGLWKASIATLKEAQQRKEQNGRNITSACLRCDPRTAVEAGRSVALPRPDLLALLRQQPLGEINPLLEIRHLFRVFPLEPVHLFLVAPLVIGDT